MNTPNLFNVVIFGKEPRNLQSFYKKQENQLNISQNKKTLLTFNLIKSQNNR